jgi:hypothetical protein
MVKRLPSRGEAYLAKRAAHCEHCTLNCLSLLWSTRCYVETQTGDTALSSALVMFVCPRAHIVGAE